jgi:hypothetical protein
MLVFKYGPGASSLQVLFCSMQSNSISWRWQHCVENCGIYWSFPVFWRILCSESRSAILVTARLRDRGTAACLNCCALTRDSRYIFFFPSHDSHYQTKASSFSKHHDHTQTLHSRQDSSGRVISPTQKLLPDNTKQPQRQISIPPAEFEYQSR